MSDNKNLKASLTIGGMTCASCVAHVEEALKGARGVKKVTVNLATGKAAVEYEPAQATLTAMKKAADEIGYEVVLSTANLQISGMTCASCVEHVRKAVGDLPGVYNAVVNLATNSARVEYEPGITSLSEIKRAIEEIGYGAEEKVEGQAALDREKEARQREIQRQRLNLIIAWSIGLLVMLGTFQPYWFLPNIIPAWMNNKVFLFFLTTPIVFGPGRQFFVNSWNGLKRGLTDMNLLYATGIGAAYFIAVINTFFPEAGLAAERLLSMKWRLWTESSLWSGGRIKPKLEVKWAASL